MILSNFHNFKFELFFTVYVGMYVNIFFPSLGRGMMMRGGPSDPQRGSFQRGPQRGRRMRGKPKGNFPPYQMRF